VDRAFAVEMRKKPSRRVVRMESDDEDVVDSTMCGLDVDPLSGRGHYFHVLEETAI